MMKATKARVKVIGFLFLTACVIGTMTQPLSAQASIPQGSTITAAQFSIFVSHGQGQVVTLHRITAGWSELSVTYTTFNDQYEAGAFGSFMADNWGWEIFDVMALVQSWVNGTSLNFGILMRQAATTPYSNYLSSEWADVALRPKLEIWYTTPSGIPQSVVIQRSGITQDGVEDAFITQSLPTLNFGDEEILSTGNLNGYEKYSLIRFNFDITPPCSPGTGTPGYWMNHPEAWPISGIMIGGRYYAMDEAIGAMKAPVATDKTFTMFAALVATKLNVMIGNDAGCINSTIVSADAWMEDYPLGSGVRAGGPASPWRMGETFYLMLDRYNNGLLCAPPRY